MTTSKRIKDNRKIMTQIKITISFRNYTDRERNHLKKKKNSALIFEFKLQKLRKLHKFSIFKSKQTKQIIEKTTK